MKKEIADNIMNPDMKNSHVHMVSETPERMRQGNGWSSILEKEVKNMSELSRAYSWLHYKSYRIYTNSNERITLLILIITTALMIPNLIDPSSIEYKNLLRIFNIILTISIGFLSGYSQLKDYGGRSQSHREAAQQFSRINDAIRQELMLYRKDRHQANHFIEYQSQILDIYITSSPEINDNIIKMFKKRFGNIKIQLPNFMNDDIDQFAIVSPIEFNKKTSEVIPLEFGLNIGREDDEHECESDHEFENITKTKGLTKLRYEMNRFNSHSPK